jgi:hypothetical protein
VTEQPNDATPEDAAHPEWFRGPTRREHWLAAALFVAFGVFFMLLFVVTAGWWFRWVTLALGVYSILHGLGHARDACRMGDRDGAGGGSG